MQFFKMEIMKYSIIVVLSCVCTFVSSEIGTQCIIKKTNQIGTCSLITDCPPALSMLKNGTLPDACSFKNEQFIVCCPSLKDAIIFPNEDKPKYAMEVTGRELRRSQQKCKEYSKYHLELVRPPVLMSNPELVQENKCGMLAKELVVGGKKAVGNEFAHMAMLGTVQDTPKFKVICGGSIISDRYVLTAAHCLSKRAGRQPLYIRVGIAHIDEMEHMQQYKVIEMIKHPQYKARMRYHDIGLVRTQKPIILNPYVKPACLNSDPRYVFSYTIATGWGKTGYAEDSSKHLLKVGLDTFDVPFCNNIYKENDDFNITLPQGLLEESMICVGSNEDGKDTCQGDSGGPLQIEHRRDDGIECMYDIVGVVSFGKSCGFKNVPSIATRVSHYIQWIEDVVWPY